MHDFLPENKTLRYECSLGATRAFSVHFYMQYGVKGPLSSGLEVKRPYLQIKTLELKKCKNVYFKSILTLYLLFINEFFLTGHVSPNLLGN